MKKSLNELIRRLHGLKAVKRCGILDTCIMSIKRNDILYPHTDQLVKCAGAVKGLSAYTLALTAFIKIRHDHIHSSRLAADGADHTLQILEMIVRGHQVGVIADRVAHAVITYIY